MIKRALLPWLLAGALLSPLPALAQRAGRGREVETDHRTSLERELTSIQAIRQRYQGVAGELAAGPLSRGRNAVSERYQEALYSYLVADYERAALIFYSLLENGDLERDPDVGSKADAEFYLADAFYLDEAWFPAALHFATIVERGATHPYYTEAVMKLIEIFGLTGDSEAFENYYDRFLANSRNDTPGALRIRYTLGRTLYRQGRVSEARERLSEFPRGSTYTPMAHYFMGVLEVLSGYRELSTSRPNRAVVDDYFDRARVEFEGVLELPSSTEEQREVMDLAQLGLARLLHERARLTRDEARAAFEEAEDGRDQAALEAALAQREEADVLFEQAVTIYEDVRPISPHYADALYEISWCWIEQRRFDEADRSIDIFLLAYPEHVREPELRVLQGHLRRKLERYDDAVLAYEDVVANYEGIEVQLDDLLRSSSDPIVYFEQLLEEGNRLLTSENSVPPLALRMAEQSDNIQSAINVAGHVSTGEEDIAFSQQLVDLLDQAVYEQEARNLLRRYRDTRERLDTVDERISQSTARLAQLEAEVLAEALESSGSATAQALTRRRTELAEAAGAHEAAFAALGRKRDDLERQAAALTEAAFQVEFLIEGLQEQIEAARSYLVTTRRSGVHDEASEAQLRQQISEESAELASLQAELEQLREQLTPRFLTDPFFQSASAELSAQAERLEDEVAALDREMQEAGRQVNDPEVNALVGEIREARDSLTSLSAQSDATRSLLARTEEQEIVEVRRVLEDERERLRGYEQEMQLVRGDADEVNGDLMGLRLAVVGGEIADTVVDAAVGVVDVYWEQKVAASERLTEAKQQRSDTLAAMREAYWEILFDPEEEEE